jgi:N6-adenosine-specific RNA methylase IME4
VGRRRHFTAASKLPLSGQARCSAKRGLYQLQFADTSRHLDLTVIDRAQPTIALDRVIVGERHRHDMGDIAGLAESIREVGLLHPIVITPGGVLVAGERRLHAWQLLGWKEIPYRVVDLAAVVRGEFAENAVRKPFTPSEMVAIAAAIEPLERAKARARQLQGTRSEPSENFSQGPTGRALDKVARLAGVSRPTLKKAQQVCEAADAEPDRFGKLVEAMDKTGRVNGPHRRLLNMRQPEAIRAEPPPLPNNGPYRAVVCDVPWPSEPNDADPSERGYWPFPTMSIEQLCKLDVSSIMHADSVLWFWTTNFHMRHAYTILDAWGFHSRPTILTWAKDRPGRGQRLLGQTEHAIMAVRGNPVITLTNQTTLLRAPVRKPLGSKPPEFYDLVESLCPAPRYADLFSRYRHSERWDCHGDDAPTSGAAPVASNGMAAPQGEPTTMPDIPDFLRRQAANAGATP